jgi:excinuclease ABC subunit C
MDSFSLLISKNPDLKSGLTHLSQAPGVYRMFNADNKIIYVGKAKNLAKRVSSYFQGYPDFLHENLKTRALVSDVVYLEVTVTRSEAEALILENHLIKAHQPKYNIIFKDDKSYPYLYLSTQDAFPKLIAYRGERKKQGLSFGPYPNLLAARETLKLLQKIFPIRNCEESFFKSRSRPCLQHQIGRCSAPCVKLISKEAYAFDIEQVKLFLQGKDQKIMEDLAVAMEQASENWEFEKASKFRDQLRALQKAQESQVVLSGSSANADVIALARGAIGAFFAIGVLFIRAGRVLGSRVFFPESFSEQDSFGLSESLAENNSEILMAFLSQFYGVGQGGLDLPAEIIVSENLSELVSESGLLAQEKNLQWKFSVRGLRAKWVEMAKLNAEEALKTKFAGKLMYLERFEALEKLLKLEKIQTIECFDISHSLGEATVASCVVFNREGPNKKKYRRFNIEDGGGDDYAAIALAVSRHFSRLIKEGAPWPDLLVIDGGAAQLSSAVQALESLGVKADQSFKVLGVSKAELRKSGFEQLWQVGQKIPLVLGPEDLGLHLIQEIRDEAHRFAISAHRKQRLKRRVTSVLEHIPGVGAKRRQALLNHFGSLAEIKAATVDELRKVQGVSTSVAKGIYDWARK